MMCIAPCWETKGQTQKETLLITDTAFQKNAARVAAERHLHFKEVKVSNEKRWDNSRWFLGILKKSWLQPPHSVLLGVLLQAITPFAAGHQPSVELKRTTGPANLPRTQFYRLSCRRLRPKTRVFNRLNGRRRLEASGEMGFFLR